MNRRQFAVSFLVAGAVATRAFAQVDDRRRNDQGGGGGQPVGVYKVVSIDSYTRTVDLKGVDGTVSKVKVPEGIYELGKLSVGDTIQVNFYTPDAMNPGLRAAAIWPVGR